jgi:hypothetical protein
MRSNEPLSYDFKTTCPSARWSEKRHDYLEYAIEGLQPCAIISNGDGESFSWVCEVTCAIAQRQVRSRRGRQEDCINEAAYWLRQVNCPGHIFPLPAQPVSR